MRVLAPLVFATSAVVAFNQPGNDAPLAMANQVPLQNSVDRALLFGRKKDTRSGYAPRPGVFSRIRQKLQIKRGTNDGRSNDEVHGPMMKYTYEQLGECKDWC
ncbi:hypothetical protein Ae201684P_008187 [Aphanomyces euteiches]|uniref:RxLR effector protein n=1 Tax=Aphanomyces euteiches TaxID=100861 RepID=A0A6G0XP40_9STRA|nr:hypothetical protein Ae201684_002971 [Aphanomyces euteiches]KAH9092512.1 hypothetical protein Ae201684P_008187 [Aphanomyces euteiches]